jgi:hypothetical protein
MAVQPTPTQIAEAMAELERVRAEQAAEKAKAAPATKAPAGLLPIDFTDSSKRPLSAAEVNTLVEGWRSAYSAFDYDPEIVEIMEHRLRAALERDGYTYTAEPPENRLRWRLRQKFMDPH